MILKAPVNDTASHVMALEINMISMSLSTTIKACPEQQLKLKLILFEGDRIALIGYMHTLMVDCKLEHFITYRRRRGAQMSPARHQTNNKTRITTIQ